MNIKRLYFIEHRVGNTVSKSNGVTFEVAVPAVVDNATRFIEQLNSDMQLINKDINLITSCGQQFIERHLQQFQLIGFSNDINALPSDIGARQLPLMQLPRSVGP